MDFKPEICLQVKLSFEQRFLKDYAKSVCWFRVRNDTIKQKFMLDLPN